MSTFVELIRAELVAATAVTDLVGTRVFPQVAPQGTLAPYLVLTVVTDLPLNSVTGTVATRLRTARLQVDAYGGTYLQAHQLAAAVRTVVGDLARPELSAYELDSRDLYDDETPELRRVSMDFAVTA